jgi:predicted nucleotidyltransferase
MPEAVSLKQRDKAALDDFVEKVREELKDNIIGIRLFGSKAEGPTAEDSDIDVLIIVSESDVSIEDRIVDIAFDINLLHDVYISPRVISQAIMDHPVWRMTPFIQSLQKEGIDL